MPPDVQVDDEHVHVLETGDVGRSRLPLVLSLVAVLLVGGVGAWVTLTDPFAGAEQAAPPPAASGNLLGDAWSFEITAAGDGASAWIGDPLDFVFGAASAVSGERGATARPGKRGYSRMWTARAFELGAHRGAVELSAVGATDRTQLFLRFEAADRPPVDVAVASGAGPIRGRCAVPPGSRSVRAGVGCVGAGGVDDLDLRLVAGPADGLLERGIFRVQRLPRGLLVFRGDAWVAHLSGPSVQPSDGPGLPPAVAALPSREALAAGDAVLSLEAELSEDGPRLQLLESVQGLAPDTPLLRVVRVAAAVAGRGVGVVSPGGFERFSDDFQVAGARALVLGRTQDRLVLSVDGEAGLVGAFGADGGLVVRMTTPASLQRLTLQTGFQAERVEAAQHRDTALEHERAGRLGAALGQAERILARFPYDDDVLAEAAAMRARIQATMQARLDVIDRDLEDALFLGSSRRCRELLADCAAALRVFAGNAAADRFAERSRTVAERAADLLQADRDRRAGRLRALVESFRAHGGYEHVADELERALPIELGEGGR